MDEVKIKTFSEKVEKLIAHCQKLEADNQALRDMQDDWQQERAKLMQKNDLARNKIESMIERLKALG